MAIWLCANMNGTQIRTVYLVSALLFFGLAGGSLTAGLTGGPLASTVFWELRLPRLLLAALAGAGFAMAGSVMQALFRNPLAEPALLGVSAGAALGAACSLVLGLTAWLLPATAFLGGLAATALALLVARGAGGTSSAGLLLAGVAINAICGSGLALLNYLAEGESLRGLVFWTMGGFGGASWEALALTLPLSLWVLLWLALQWRVLDALMLGEAEAYHVGFDVRHWRRKLVGLTALLVGALVAQCGVIGFVGLLVPHLARLTLGAGHRRLLPLAMLWGASLLVGADWAARSLIAPAELPIGLLTSLIGGPFFLWLLLRQGGSRC